MTAYILTVAEAETQLAQVNAAIEQLVLGKTIVEFTAGSADFQTRYKKGEVSLAQLRELRTELILFLGNASPIPWTPTFNKFATIPLVMKKGY